MASRRRCCRFMPGEYRFCEARELIGSPPMAELRLLREDEEIVAVEKPAGRPSIPGRGEIGEPVVTELRRRLGRPLWVVHRLDLDASGVLVFAKTAAAHRRLSAAFEGRQAKKTYLALVEGELAQGGEIDRPLRQFGSGRM